MYLYWFTWNKTASNLVLELVQDTCRCDICVVCGVCRSSDNYRAGITWCIIWLTLTDEAFWLVGWIPHNNRLINLFNCRVVNLLNILPHCMTGSFELPMTSFSVWDITFVRSRLGQHCIHSCGQRIWYCGRMVATFLGEFWSRRRRPLSVSFPTLSLSLYRMFCTQTRRRTYRILVQYNRQVPWLPCVSAAARS